MPPKGRAKGTTGTRGRKPRVSVYNASPSSTRAARSWSSYPKAACLTEGAKRFAETYNVETEEDAPTATKLFFLIDWQAKLDSLRTASSDSVVLPPAPATARKRPIPRSSSKNVVGKKPRLTFKAANSNQKGLLSSGVKANVTTPVSKKSTSGLPKKRNVKSPTLTFAQEAVELEVSSSTLRTGRPRRQAAVDASKKITRLTGNQIMAKQTARRKKGTIGLADSLMTPMAEQTGSVASTSQQPKMRTNNSQLFLGDATMSPVARPGDESMNATRFLADVPVTSTPNSASSTLQNRTYATPGPHSSANRDRQTGSSDNKTFYTALSSALLPESEERSQTNEDARDHIAASQSSPDNTVLLAPTTKLRLINEKNTTALPPVDGMAQSVRSSLVDTSPPKRSTRSNSCGINKQSLQVVAAHESQPRNDRKVLHSSNNDPPLSGELEESVGDVSMNMAEPAYPSSADRESRRIIVEEDTVMIVDISFTESTEVFKAAGEGILLAQTETITILNYDMGDIADQENLQLKDEVPKGTSTAGLQNRHEESEWEADDEGDSPSTTNKSPQCPSAKVVRPKAGRLSKSTSFRSKRIIRPVVKRPLDAKIDYFENVGRITSNTEASQSCNTSFKTTSSVSPSSPFQRNMREDSVHASAAKKEDALRRRVEVVKQRQEESKRTNEERARKAQEKRDEVERQRLLKVLEQQKQEEAAERNRIEADARKHEKTTLQCKQRAQEAEARRQAEKEKLKKQADDLLNSERKQSRPQSASKPTSATKNVQKPVPVARPPVTQKPTPGSGVKTSGVADSCKTFTSSSKAADSTASSSAVAPKPVRGAFRQLANPNKAFTPLPPVDLTGLQAAKRMAQMSSSKISSASTSSSMASVPTLDSLQSAFASGDGHKMPATLITGLISRPADHLSSTQNTAAVVELAAVGPLVKGVSYDRGDMQTQRSTGSLVDLIGSQKDVLNHGVDSTGNAEVPLSSSAKSVNDLTPPCPTQDVLLHIMKPKTNDTKPDELAHGPSDPGQNIDITCPHPSVDNTVVRESRIPSVVRLSRSPRSAVTSPKSVKPNSDEALKSRSSKSDGSVAGSSTKHPLRCVVESIGSSKTENSNHPAAVNPLLKAKNSAPLGNQTLVISPKNDEKVTFPYVPAKTALRPKLPSPDVSGICPKVVFVPPTLKGNVQPDVPPKTAPVTHPPSAKLTFFPAAPLFVNHVECTKLAPSLEYTDYGLDVDENDDTDEEDRPRKEVPRWAVKENLILSIHTQLLTPVSLDEMFDGARPEKVDLPAIFQKKSDRYNRRGSSQMWTHGVLPLGVSTPHHHPSKAKDDVNF